MVITQLTNNRSDRSLNHFSLLAYISLKSLIISFPPEQNQIKPGYGNVQIFFFFFFAVLGFNFKPLTKKI